MKVWLPNWEMKMWLSRTSTIFHLSSTKPSRTEPSLTSCSQGLGTACLRLCSTPTLKYLPNTHPLLEIIFRCMDCVLGGAGRTWPAIKPQRARKKEQKLQFSWLICLIPLTLTYKASSFTKTKWEIYDYLHYI